MKVKLGPLLDGICRNRRDPLVDQCLQRPVTVEPCPAVAPLSRNNCAPVLADVAADFFVFRVCHREWLLSSYHLFNDVYTKVHGIIGNFPQLTCTCIPS